MHKLYFIYRKTVDENRINFDSNMSILENQNV